MISVSILIRPVRTGAAAMTNIEMMRQRMCHHETRQDVIYQHIIGTAACDRHGNSGAGKQTIQYLRQWAQWHTHIDVLLVAMLQTNRRLLLFWVYGNCKDGLKWRNRAVHSPSCALWIPCILESLDSIEPLPSFFTAETETHDRTSLRTDNICYDC